MQLIRKNLLLVIALAVLPSSLVFLIGVSIIELVFFVLTIGLITTIVIAAGMDGDLQLYLPIQINEESLPALFLALFLIAFGLVFLIPESTFTVFFVAVLILTLPGYVLLRILRVKTGSILETVALSHGVSLTVNGFLFLPIILFAVDFVRVYLLIAMTVLVAIPLWQTGKSNITRIFDRTAYSTRFGLLEFASLAFAVVTFIAIIIIEYPRAANYPEDIWLLSARSYAYSNGFPVPSPYPLFLLNQASVIVISAIPQDYSQIFRTGMAAMSVFVLLSFYVMTKRMIPEEQRKTRFVATNLLVVGGGVGWLWMFAAGGISQLGHSAFSFLLEGNYYTGADTLYSQGLSWLKWYRPESEAIVELLLLIYLLRKQLPVRQTYIIFPIILLGLGIHTFELVFFSVFLMILYLVMPRDFFSPNLDRIVIISGLTFIPLSVIFVLFTQEPLAGYVQGILAVMLLFLRMSGKQNFSFKFSRFGAFFIQALFIITISLLIQWFFEYSTISANVTVPPMVYAVRLGVPLILSLLFFLWPKNLKEHAKFFLLWVTTAFLVASATSIVNLYILATGFPEIRYTTLIFVGLLIPASIVLVSLIKQILPPKGLLASE